LSNNYMLLYGKNSIKERLRNYPESVKKIFFADNFKSPDIEKLIEIKKIPTERLPLRKIENMKRAKNVQGIVARVEPFAYAEFADLLDTGKKSKSCLVFLDRINDPQNLGIILRTLACFGNFYVVIPENEACEITDAVMHVASGGENYVRVARIKDFPKAIACARDKGFFVIGAVPSIEAKDICDTRFSFPLAIILGSEAKGISPELFDLVDAQIKISMPGAGLSLNVSMACAIFAHEIVKQRGQL